MADLYVGIDIGSESHQVCMMNESHEAFLRLRLPHSLREIARFIETVKSLQKEQGATTVVVGMESSNGYASPLDRLLVQAGFKLVAINSVALDKYRQLVGQPRKDDPYDAQLIAAYLIDLYGLKGLRRNLQEIGHPGQSSKGNLRIFTRQYRTTKRDLTRVVNRLKKHLLGYFPDFLEAFPDLQSKTARTLLKHYGAVGKIQKGSVDRIARLKISEGRTVGPKAAKKLKDLVAAISFSDPLEGSMWKMTQDLVHQVEVYLEQLEGLRETIEEIASGMETIRSVAEEIPGAGPLTSAELMAEIGEISRFATRDKLSLYCGIGCLNRSSGKKQGTRKPLLVNHRAKATLCLMAQAAILHDEKSKTYYKKKRDEGKSHWHAIKCLAKYLIRRIFILSKKTESQQERLEEAA